MLRAFSQSPTSNNLMSGSCCDSPAYWQWIGSSWRAVLHALLCPKQNAHYVNCTVQHTFCCVRRTLGCSGCLIRAGSLLKRPTPTRGVLISAPPRAKITSNSRWVQPARMHGVLNVAHKQQPQECGPGCCLQTERQPALLISQAMLPSWLLLSCYVLHCFALQCVHHATIGDSPALQCCDSHILACPQNRGPTAKHMPACTVCCYKAAEGVATPFALFLAATKTTSQTLHMSQEIEIVCHVSSAYMVAWPWISGQGFNSQLWPLSFISLGANAERYSLLPGNYARMWQHLISHFADVKYSGSACVMTIRMHNLVRLSGLIAGPVARPSNFTLRLMLPCWCAAFRYAVVLVHSFAHTSGCNTRQHMWYICRWHKIWYLKLPVQLRLYKCYAVLFRVILFWPMALNTGSRKRCSPKDLWQSL